MSRTAFSRRLRASLACLAALPLSALMLGACADRGTSPEAGQGAANAEAAGNVSGAGTIDFLLGDPDQPVTRRVTVPGAENLRVLVSRLDGIVDDFFVRDGAKTTVALLSDNDRDDGFLPYEVIVAGDTTFLTASGLGSARVTVRDAGNVRPDNAWVTRTFPARQASRETFSLPGAKGLRVVFEGGVFFPEGSDGKVRIESEAGRLELGENDLVQAGRGDTDDNIFRVTGDTVTVSVDTLRNVDFQFNITEDKALR